MTFETMLNTIRKRFRDEIADAESVDVAYDNAQFTPPSDKEWVNLTILPGQSFQATLGETKTFRTPGVMVAQIMVPLNRGEGPAYVLADKIKDAFRAVTVSGVVFKTPYVSRGGRADNWWQLTVSCPFYADDLA